MNLSGFGFLLPYVKNKSRREFRLLNTEGIFLEKCNIAVNIV